MSKVPNVGFTKATGQLSKFQYLIFCLNVSSISEFYILEGTRDQFLAPINDSVSVRHFTSLTIFVLSKSYGCSVSLKSDSHLPKKICVICLIESPLKMMKNAFYFILKAFFILKIFQFLSRLFGHLGKTA